MEWDAARGRVGDRCDGDVGEGEEGVTPAECVLISNSPLEFPVDLEGETTADGAQLGSGDGGLFSLSKSLDIFSTNASPTPSSSTSTSPSAPTTFDLLLIISFSKSFPIESLGLKYVPTTSTTNPLIAPNACFDASKNGNI